MVRKWAGGWWSSDHNGVTCQEASAHTSGSPSEKWERGDNRLASGHYQYQLPFIIAINVLHLHSEEICVFKWIKKVISKNTQHFPDRGRVTPSNMSPCPWLDLLTPGCLRSSGPMRGQSLRHLTNEKPAWSSPVPPLISRPLPDCVQAFSPKM